MNRVALPRRPEALPASAVVTASHNAAQSGDSVSSVLTRWPVLRDIARVIGSRELQRRLTHMSPGLLPLLLWVIPHQDPWGPLLVNTMLAISVMLAGVILVRFRAVARTDAELGVSAVVGYTLPVVAAILLLPGRAEIGMMTLAILAVGDGSATLGGLWFRGRRLPWNRRKTFAGLLSFCVCGTLLATIIYWGEAQPVASWTAALTCAFCATVTAAVVESLPWPGNDNLRVGVTAACVGACVQIFWLGC
jgi:phytol kinase